MAISLQSIQSGVSNAPPRILVYSMEGLGKTTMIANAPHPILIRTEDGEGEIDMPRFPLAKSYDDVMDSLKVLALENHPYKTVGIDSLDWFEPLVWKKVISDNPIANKAGKAVSTIEDYDFQKGYKMAMEYWREYLDAINYLRNTRGMMIIQTAHAAIQRFDDPVIGGYDRFGIKLHISKRGEGIAAIMQEQSDCVFFIDEKSTVVQEKSGAGQTKGRVVSGDQRVLYTRGKKSYSAKTRYSLPDAIPFDKEGAYWGVLANSIPFLKSLSVPVSQGQQEETDQSQQQE